MRESRPVSLIVRKGLFGDYALQNKRPDIAGLKREDAIEGILKVLPGETLEAFLSRSDLDGNAVVPLRFTEPMPYAAYPFADLAEKGPRFFEGWFRPNRVDIFLLPRCGVPTIFSFSFRLFGLFGFAFCLGKRKIWMPRGRR